MVANSSATPVQIFFKTIREGVGHELDDISDWAAQRIKGLSLFVAVVSALASR